MPRQGHTTPSATTGAHHTQCHDRDTPHSMSPVILQYYAITHEYMCVESSASRTLVVLCCLCVVALLALLKGCVHQANRFRRDLPVCIPERLAGPQRNFVLASRITNSPEKLAIFRGFTSGGKNVVPAHAVKTRERVGGVGR